MIKDPAKAEIAKRVGQHIRWAREARDRSQLSVAEDCGAHATHWGAYEKGKRIIPPNILREFCARFELTYEYIYEGDLDGLPADLQQVLAALHPELVLEKRRKVRHKDNAQA